MIKSNPDSLTADKRIHKGITGMPDYCFIFCNLIIINFQTLKTKL